MSSLHSLLSVLQRQHAHIGMLLARVGDSSGTARHGAVADLLQYVALHESAEQTFMHPVALKSVGDVAAVQGRVVEEREIEAVITRLEGLDPASVDFMIYFGLLEEAMSGHTRAEENVEARVLGAVPDHDLEHMARGIELVDVWMDPAARLIDGSVARMPLRPGVTDVGFSEMHRRSLEAFDAVFRLR